MHRSRNTSRAPIRRRRPRARLTGFLVALASVLIVSWATPPIALAQVGAPDAASTFAEAPVGAGTGTTGGAGGKVVAVTSMADSGPGTLRDRVKAPGPRIVVFATSGQIALKNPVSVGSNITIDGRGVDVTLTGKGLILDGVENVIIRNLRFDNGTGGDTDAITVMNASKKVWIDHNELAHFTDGLIDVTQLSTDVTISWNLLRDHDKASLLGWATPNGTPALVDITVHHNRYLRTNARSPMMRHGRFHVYDDVVEAFGTSRKNGYGVKADCGAISLVESTMFVLSERNIDVEAANDGCDPGRAPALRLVDVDAGGGKVEENQPSLVPAPDQWSDHDQVQPAGPILLADVRANAGWKDVPRAYPLPAPEPEQTVPAPSTKSSSESSTVLLVVGIVVVLFGGGLAFLLARRSRSRRNPRGDRYRTG